MASIEYSPNSDAHCQECRGMINAGSVRVCTEAAPASRSSGIINTYTHADCYKNCMDKDFMKLRGFRNLAPEDQKRFMTEKHSPVDTDDFVSDGVPSAGQGSELHREDGQQSGGRTEIAIASTSEDIFIENEMPEEKNERVNEMPEGKNERLDIPNDSFSMLWVGDSCADYFLPIMVFFLQVSILVLIGYNLLQEKYRPLSNFWDIPVEVPLAVTMSQYIACFVSVFTADDLITGMLYIGKRVIHKEYSPMDGVLPPVSWKWEISNSMRFVEGACVIAVSFIFIVQSSTVIDLFLNFAGVSFVGFLDNTSFLLAENGLLGKRAKKLAKGVSNFEVYKVDDRSANMKMIIIRVILFVGITVCMWVGLSVFVQQQNAMVYACKSVTVSVEGGVYEYARYFSGSYTRFEKRVNQRAAYVKNQGASAAIYYDKYFKLWALSYLDNVQNLTTRKPSLDFTLMSENTNSFDITEVGEFRFWTDEAAEAEVRCNDCNPQKKRESCSWQGECNKETKSCKCNPGFFGDRCQHIGPCSEMIMEVDFEGTKYTPIYGLKQSFDLLYHENKPFMWLGFPVYSQKLSSRYMFFDGGRWNVIQVEHNSTADISDLLANISHYDVIYVSEPAKSASPAYLGFRARLVDREGYWDDDSLEKKTGIGKLGEKEFHFFCADCFNGTEGGGISLCVDESGRRNHDICETVESELHGTVNRCNCKPGFLGPLCEIRPSEGTVKLHLDYGTGFCPVCGEANDWSLWPLDGIQETCLPIPKKPLSFEGTNGTVVRQMGLGLNRTHFSLFVSGSNVTNATNDLCLANDVTKEIYSIKRNISDNQIKFDHAIYFDKTNDFLGEIIDPEGIECGAETNVDQSICDEAGLLQRAWIWLDIKITPIKD